jgi:hypothetical protein
MGALLGLILLLDITGDAKRLLAHCLRGMGIEPKTVAVSNVSVQGDTASLTWSAATHHGELRLARHDDRWWWTANAADRTCGVVFSPYNASGYGVTVYVPAALRSGVQIYARAPTHAEFLPNPAPPKDWGGPTDVGFFDIINTSTKPLAFASGTQVDVWFPFAFDDTLRYDVSIFANAKSYGPFNGTLFDNVMHFELPAFTIAPGESLQAEISGWY